MRKIREKSNERKLRRDSHLEGNARIDRETSEIRKRRLTLLKPMTFS